MSRFLRDEVIRLAREMVGNYEIAARLGTSPESVKVMISRARAYGVEIPYGRPGFKSGRPPHKTEAPIDRAAMNARIKTVPADTRDLTALICGDPLPGRSALDRSAS